MVLFSCIRKTIPTPFKKELQLLRTQ
uniref:Uncharacterized protein n=1 Tax=Rhizophora mucronata TaxID=61149 RepID=A0A2P2NB01_RHIMU